MFTRTSQVSSIAFTSEDVEKNLHLNLINFLFDYNNKADDNFFDINITTDGCCLIVEFVNLTRGVNDNTEGFAYIDEEHEVLKIVKFPDTHYEYMADDEAEEALKKWLTENPGWKKDEFGRWWYDKPKKENENEFKIPKGGRHPDGVWADNWGDTDGDREVYYKFKDADGDKEVSKGDLADLNNHLNNVEKTLTINKKESSEIK